MYTFLVFTGSARATLGSAAVPPQVQPRPSLTCSKTRPGLGKCLSIKVGREGETVALSSCVLSIVTFFVSLCRLVVLVRAVRQTVPSQVTVAPKHLSAAATAVGLDVCMGEKVSFQVTSLIKGSSACGAFVG